MKLQTKLFSVLLVLVLAFSLVHVQAIQNDGSETETTEGTRGKQ